MLMAMMLPLVASCSKDSDDSPQNVELISQAVGTWMCTASRDTQTNGLSYDGLMAHSLPLHQHLDILVHILYLVIR